METKYPLIKRGWLRALLFFFTFFIFITLFDLVGIAIVAYYSEYGFEEFISDPELIMENKMMLLMMVCQLIGTIFTVGLFQKFISREDFVSIGLNFVGFKIDFYKGLLAGTVLICSGFILLTVLNLTLIDLTYFSFYDQIFYFFLFTIVSLNEEIAIRGYILHNLSSSFNKYVALIISSLVFMIMHLGNPNIGILPLVNLFLAGIFLGIYTIHKNNLWFPIGAHLTWNYLQGPIFGFEVSGNKINSLFEQKPNGHELLTGGNFGFEGSIILTLFLMISIFYMDGYFQKPNIFKPSTL
ncbi:CPBP family intramembrane metalloprotease [bacterium]|jgi:membrane protease YdiL (CAAX protease family)|nr:CPBP family intramembrane metalloprotease [bacterium]MDG1224451.1 CPBP family intramembrane metalloprotease [Candidatus Neomarinimicrobiota bacterium]MBT4926998.1 CPBP family intramembrane metalloprotease [bacterium]MBT5734134.1 CPBP family intramembrane metalloprotease [bacterium]MBT6777098.1 CPBP family intramembrane metalloprotease [bacterium]